MLMQSDSMAPSQNIPPRWLDRLAELQVTKPWWIALLVAAITAPALLGTLRLGLKTDLSELLPENKPSVVEMRRVSEKLISASTLTIVAEGKDTKALERFVDELAPRLRALGPEWVGSVDDGVRETRKFLEDNKLLYAPLEDVRKLHDEVLERYDYEVGKRSGMGDLGLGEPAEPLTAESVKRRIREAEDKATQGAPKHPGGYYLGEDGHTIVMLVRTPVEGGSERAAAALRERVDRAIAEVDPRRLDPSMRIGFTGDFITSVEEYRGIKDDLAQVGVFGVSMVLAVVLLFFLRIRALVAMAITIAIGLVWAFGATRLAIGHLNSSTGFLVSIIAGNGINFGIIYMARYLEARRAQHQPVLEAIRTAHRDTWLSTLAASAAAMVAYGSLAVTDFRGFKHFGIIGGMGMLLCWAATYLSLPVVLAASERVSPMFADPTAWRSRVHGFYGYLFAIIAERVPRAVVVLAVLSGLGSTALAVRYLRQDPMEYNLEKLSNTHRGRESAARLLSWRVDQIVGRMGQDGMAILVDRLDQVAPLQAELERRKAAAPEAEKPFEKVVTVFDLLPSDQTEKIALVEEALDRIRRAHDRNIIGEQDWKDLEPQLPQKALVPVGVQDLPERMAHLFTERDGTRGRIVYIAPREGRSVWDAHYLELWANSFRSVTLPSGEVIRGSGRAVIWSDMLRAVREDAPKAIGTSLAGTLLVVLLAFRARRSSWAVMGTLLLGVAWLAAFVCLRDIKMNFLNFVAVPITFGVGADYALNMMRRFRIEDPSNARQVIVETGGAVVLCSLTTTLGYLALMFSVNQAIVSFGQVAAAGEVTTLVAGVLVLPAALIWRKRRLSSRTAPHPATAVTCERTGAASGP
jgi:predicted RND superfamily exporter protein